VVVELDERFFPADSDFLLLDIGPGAGGLSEHHAQHRRVVTVEFDEGLAREVAQRSAGSQLSSCQGDAHALPVRSGSVDGVIALEVLEHVVEPERVIAEASRVLKPNGALCVAVPTGYTERIYSRLHPRYMSNATHVRIFKKAELSALLQRHGFRDPVVRTENLEPAVIWTFHAILRSDADATGHILDHPSIEPRVTRIANRISATRGVGRLLRVTRRHFGKSWYVYARKGDSG
jgi:SAM-dependent methyltransferase